MGGTNKLKSILSLLLCLPTTDYNPGYLHFCVLYMCRGVCKLVHHHIPNTRLTQRDDNIIDSRIAITYLHTDTCESILQAQLVDSTTSVQGVNSSLTLPRRFHSACAKHFSPEATKVRQKKFARPGVRAAFINK